MPTSPPDANKAQRTSNVTHHERTTMSTTQNLDSTEA